MTEVQCFDGDGQDPEETGEWDAVDLSYIKFTHRVDITSEDWAAIGKDFDRAMKSFDGLFDGKNTVLGYPAGQQVGNQNIAVGALGRLAAIGKTTTQKEAMDIIHQRTKPALDAAMSRLDATMERLRHTAERLGRRS